MSLLLRCVSAGHAPSQCGQLVIQATKVFLAALTDSAYYKAQMLVYQGGAGPGKETVLSLDPVHKMLMILQL